MQINLPCIILLLVIQFGFSQTQKLFEGVVVYNDFVLKNIEIVNLRTEKSATTDNNGAFMISTQVNDTLVFISKQYEYKSIFLNAAFLDKTNYTIALLKKTEELDEVVVISKIAFGKIKFDSNIASQLAIEKATINRKPTGVHDGVIENGIGIKMSLERNRKKTHQIDFKELIKKNEKYYLDILHLKPSEFGLFLAFCEADPQSKKVIENYNPLLFLDYLFAKNAEHHKIIASDEIKLKKLP